MTDQKPAAQEEDGAPPGPPPTPTDLSGYDSEDGVLYVKSPDPSAGAETDALADWLDALPEKEGWGESFFQTLNAREAATRLRATSTGERIECCVVGPATGKDALEYVYPLGGTGPDIHPATLIIHGRGEKP